MINILLTHSHEQAQGFVTAYVLLNQNGIVLTSEEHAPLLAILLKHLAHSEDAARFKNLGHSEDVARFFLDEWLKLDESEKSDLPPTLLQEVIRRGNVYTDYRLTYDEYKMIQKYSIPLDQVMELRKRNIGGISFYSSVSDMLTDYLRGLTPIQIKAMEICRMSKEQLADQSPEVLQEKIDRINTRFSLVAYRVHVQQEQALSINQITIA